MMIIITEEKEQKKFETVSENIYKDLNNKDWFLGKQYKMIICLIFFIKKSV